MRITIDRRAWARQLCWFVGLWLAGVLAVGVSAGLLRFVFRAL